MFLCVSVSPAFPVNRVQVFINRLILGVDVCLTNERFQFVDSGRSEFEIIIQLMKGRTGLGEPDGKVFKGEKLMGLQKIDGFGKLLEVADFSFLTPCLSIAPLLCFADQFPKRGCFKGFRLGAESVDPFGQLGYLRF